MFWFHDGNPSNFVWLFHIAPYPATGNSRDSAVDGDFGAKRYVTLCRATIQHCIGTLKPSEIVNIIGHYEEALDLEVHVMRLVRKYGDIGVLVAVAAEVERSTELMLTQLLQVIIWRQVT